LTVYMLYSRNHSEFCPEERKATLSTIAKR